MKHAHSLMWIAVSVILLSFSPKFGGDSFTISIDGKQVIQHYVVRQAPTPVLTLSPAPSTEEVSVYYSHCGQIGKGRSVSIKNDQQKIIKEWRFADAVNEHTAMTIKASEIKALFKNGAETLNMHYASRELPEGRLLASVHLVQAISRDSKSD